MTRSHIYNLFIIVFVHKQRSKHQINYLPKWCTLFKGNGYCIHRNFRCHNVVDVVVMLVIICLFFQPQPTHPSMDSGAPGHRTLTVQFTVDPEKWFVTDTVSVLNQSLEELIVRVTTLRWLSVKKSLVPVSIADGISDVIIAISRMIIYYKTGVIKNLNRQITLVCIF